MSLGTAIATATRATETGTPAIGPPARLLSARWVFPMAAPPIKEGAVVVDDNDRIVTVGARAALLREFPGCPEMRADGALLPALVNAHVHLELSALAAKVAGGSGFIPWALALARATGAVAPGEKRSAARAAAAEAVATGIAAIGDVGNGLLGLEAFASTTPQLCGVFFHELVGSREDRTGDALRDAEDERRAYVASQPWPAGVDYVPAPHAAYSVGPDLLRRIFAAAARQGHPTSVHVAEDADEIALLRDGGGGWPPVLDAMGVPRGSRSPGLSPVAYLDELGAFAGPTPPLLVHMVHASDEDRALAARRGATAVLCPRSNLHVGGRLPDVPVLLAAEVAIALGTDSLASSPSLSLWGELATLAASFPTVDPLVWLRAATAGGARALALADLGALAPAKRPGIIDVSPDATSTAANSDLQADAATMARALVRSTAPRVRWLAHATRQPAAGPTGAAGAAT